MTTRVRNVLEMPVLRRIADEGLSAWTCTRAGLLTVPRPSALAPSLRSIYRFGAIGGVVGLAAARFGDRAAVIDEHGTTSYRELHERSNAVANDLRRRGVQAGDGVGILTRNHRGFLESVFAAAKCGARIVLLNTDFSRPQVTDVCGREGVVLLVHDAEFADTVRDVDAPRGRIGAWVDADTGGDVGTDDTLDAIAANGDRSLPARPATMASLVVLTSGTTGTPKGAGRQDPHTLIPMGGLLDRVPLRAREVTACCVPMFHALGFAHALLAIGFGSTLLLRRRFDAAATCDDIAKHGVTGLVVVPVMLSRVLDALAADDTPVRAGRDTRSLRWVFVAGAALGVPLATRTLDVLGPVLYNLYGSTEVAYATIATPADLAAEPGCVGTVVRGVDLKIFDDDGHERPRGETGRIFVGNCFQFEGYTGGGSKEQLEGLMSSGDVGHLDDAGRLYIDGRDDDMIVSGGENVFPAEVEELLESHDDVVEAAVFGVEDDEWGQRLRAVLVLQSGSTLDEDAVKLYVRDNLARYKVPRDVDFVAELPRNATGKVLKRELREPAR